MKRADPVECIDPVGQRLRRHRWRLGVVLEAVAAREVAAARDDQLRVQRASSHHRVDELEREPRSSECTTTLAEFGQHGAISHRARMRVYYPIGYPRSLPPPVPIRVLSVARRGVF